LQATHGKHLLLPTAPKKKALSLLFFWCFSLLEERLPEGSLSLYFRPIEEYSCDVPCAKREPSLPASFSCSSARWRQERPPPPPADFKTPEYWASTGLELINAASAYAQGYTGEGIVLGIIDTPVRASHPELEGKVLGMLLPTGYPLGNWTEDAHGSHVAGIMVAASDDIGMEGVAYDADLYAVALDLRESVTTRLPWPNFLAYFAALPSVKIINNSWGGSIYPYDRGDIVQYVWDKVESEPEYQELITLATTYGKLIRFCRRQ